MVSHFEIPAPFRPKEGTTQPFILWEEIIQHSTMQRHPKWTPVSSVKHPAVKPTGQNTRGNPRWPLKGAFPCLVFYFPVSQSVNEQLWGWCCQYCAVNTGENWSLPEENLQLSNLLKIPLQTEGINFNLAVQYQTCVLVVSKSQVKV